MENNEFKLYNTDQARKAATVLRAMNHKLRQSILTVIDGEGTASVTFIYSKLNIAQAVVSQHLAILRRAKIVLAARTGKQIFYQINHPRINHYTIKIAEMIS